MLEAEKQIKSYFSNIGLPDKCVNNSIIYLKTIRAHIAELDEQIETAAKLFTGFKCTLKTKENECCLVTWGVYDVLK